MDMGTYIWRRRLKPAYAQVLHDANTRNHRRERSISETGMAAYHSYSRALCRFSRITLAGLRLMALPSATDIAKQSRILCREFIFNRLKKNGQLSLKLEILTPSSRPSDVSLEIQMLGSELERLYPFLYQDISRQLNMTMSSEEAVHNTFTSLADVMLRSGHITWGRVIGLFCVAGALAQDCVQQGHAQYVNQMVDTFGIITQKYLAQWISKQGGWPDILRAFRTTKEATTLWALTGLGAALGFTLTMMSTMG